MALFLHHKLHDVRTAVMRSVLHIWKDRSFEIKTWQNRSFMDWLKQSSDV